ncbi:phospho-N-acetylmuramoyl-pentapeptide-transferase [Helicobacter pullorum MIT 98-5489]|uniref:Phospho-N-acetylmuramoyl-pentapeptide-transferase n=2 Tax=Helicobacter pullorum TaxID=35818 RepID=A0A0N1MQE9_9HELI|nr:phospho-N-acetylmuramoyl-pentapeptide-transferase [Helicobacter pullorum]EEQ64010.1 phospho-N-acetylmuramoyl-pentapeptide-transferase [Helicobacter pullorum MIT 98-5489]KPH55245.1 phospho-N-acetylmuramoyl-pentapeptide-transferase [Helicobacter pullorum]OCR06249.1 phospho-N-acetylmuramoyl-pentapeptide-transferase [Helicobacter pullorum]STQ88233.1 phospho-N-acetylmuramoyl-pentapeptide-transferase [Helicobacter pullorum]HJF83031.1 phospho-N-acetylmuramoyl-pentapeptide-transferase [Helicobacter
MIYYLYSFLEINLFQYITFRAAIAFFVAFFLTIFIMPYYIVWARKKNANQPISQFTPQNHKQKVNIPTMGGIIFVFATLVASILCAKLDNAFVIFGLMSLVLFSSIGIYDDYSKVLQRKNAGMSAKMKFTLQAISGFLVSLGLYCYGMDSHFYLPFFKNFIWDWGLFSLLFWTLVFVATSNAVNLTDGLDGLATIPSIYALTSLGIFVYIAGHSVFSTYLLYPKIPDSGEVVVVSAALIGALIGFLWYNCHPAQVFMGDSGSLALGGVIAYMAIISKNEILLFVIGFIFVIEALSVLLQIGSYKTRGKKLFLMAPLHHHFEEKGLSESKIIVRFWIIALMSNLIALLTIKLR